MKKLITLFIALIVVSACKSNSTGSSSGTQFKSNPVNHLLPGIQGAPGQPDTSGIGSPPAPDPSLVTAQLTDPKSRLSLISGLPGAIRTNAKIEKVFAQDTTVGDAPVATVPNNDGSFSLVLPNTHAQDKVVVWTYSSDPMYVNHGDPDSSGIIKIIKVLIALPQNITSMIWSGNRFIMGSSSDGIVVCNGGPQDPNPVAVTKADGLSGSSILSLAVDNAGGAWVGTDAGVVHLQFDLNGKFSISQLPISLPSTRVNAILQIGNVLWVGTEAGLIRVALDSDNRLPVSQDVVSLSSDSPPVSSLIVDQKNLIWVGTRGDGLFRINPVTNSIDYFGTTMLASTIVNTLTLGSDGSIYVGTSHDKPIMGTEPVSTTYFGVARLAYDFSGTLHSTKFNHDFRVELQICPTRSPCIWDAPTIDYTGDGVYSLRVIDTWDSSHTAQTGVEIFAGTNRETIFHFSLNNMELNSYPLGLNDWDLGLSNTVLSDWDDTPEYGKIQSMVDDSNSTIWLGTPKGLASFPSNSIKDISLFSPPDYLPNNSVESIVKDIVGDIWLTTLRGISHISSSIGEIKIKNNDILDSAKAYQALALYEIPRSKIVYPSHIIKDHDGRIWELYVTQCQQYGPSSTPDGWDGDSNLCLRVHSPNTYGNFDEDNLPRSDSQDYTNPILTSTSIIEDSKSGVWLGVKGGLVHAFYEQSAETLWVLTLREVFYPYSADPNDNVATMLLASDANGGVWAGGNNGRIFHFSNSTFQRYILDGDNTLRTVTGIVSDGQTGVWITLSGHSDLFHLSPGLPGQHYLLKSYDSNLSNYSLTSLERTRSGQLWIGTNGYGVIRMAPSIDFATAPILSGIIVANQSTGLPSNDISALRESADGGVWIGFRSNGLVLVAP